MLSDTDLLAAHLVGRVEVEVEVGGMSSMRRAGAADA